MRHPPRSVLLAVSGTVALVAGALLPVVTAQGAAPARTVEYSVTGRWDAGFQASVKVTDNAAAVNGRSLSFDLANGQKVTQGWNAKWPRSGATVTAANESCNGSLGAGASVTTGFVASRAGANAVPVTFRLNGATCYVDTQPTPTPTPTSSPTTPPGDGGRPPALRVLGSRFVDASGATRRLLGVNRSGGEFMCLIAASSTGPSKMPRPATEACGDSTPAPVADRVPLVAGEIGENTCSHGFVDQVMRWFDEHRLSCLGWTWNIRNCSTGPALISDCNGTPTAFGVGLRDHLRVLNG
ncbi:cellulose-binding domain-containing protein [Streptomyces sp. BK239]|uniref:cellulose-binding domain-containing protein n=1 Tax=Streptomyces sp. BK239 TaxID=2512155 RepID=UPI0010D53615|nr:cellulose-binding domain-containing protein [Streptomyces sp. BK239]RZU23621.1 cellulose binding domain-containing protein [Streptomyces sp. BK239]